MAEVRDPCSENLNFPLVADSNMTSYEASLNSKAPCCVLCGIHIAESNADGQGSVDIFGRLSPAFDIIVINKLASVTGRSTAEVDSRGSRLCPGCHARLLKLHSLETEAERERALLSDLYRRSSPSPAPSAAPSGPSLLLLNDVEVRLQEDGVAAVPLTSSRRRQLLRQARSAERRFQCKVCGKRFRAFSHRVEHMLIHVNETPWACEHCPKTFRTKSARTAHQQRVHTPSESRFTCPVCDRRLADAASLRAHARTHEPHKPFTCEKCDRKFARRKDYAVHVRQHTGERPHACPECPQTFVARSRLNRHLQLHGEKKFVCRCGRAFRRRYELQRHAKSCGQPAAAVEATAAAAAVTSTAVAVAAAGETVVEMTDATSAGQAAGQAAALTYLPVMLPEAASTLYYQVVTPVAAAVEPPSGAEVAPLSVAEGESAVQLGPTQEPPPQLPVVTY